MDSADLVLTVSGLKISSGITITDIETLTVNSNSVVGGISAVSAGTVEITDATLNGASSINAESLVLDNVLVSGVTGAFAVTFTGAEMTVTDSVFADNDGAISFDSSDTESSLQITDSIFRNNSQRGAVLFANGGSMTVTDSLFSNNTYQVSRLSNHSFSTGTFNSPR